MPVAYTYLKPRLSAMTADLAVPEYLAWLSTSQSESPRRRPDRTSRTSSTFASEKVSKLCDVPAYVLRFWESEFSQLKPNKSGTGQRLYRKRDVETALHIKSLLYDEGYTIPGARHVIKTELKHKEPQLALAMGTEASGVDKNQLRKLQKDLRELLAMLSKPPARGAVHPIRAPRQSNNPRRTAEKLFDLPAKPEDSRN